MGLETAAEDLLLRCYTRWAARTFMLHGRPYEPDPKKPLPDEIELEKPDLPELVDWHRALALGGVLFGVSLASKAPHPDNLKAFEQAVRTKLGAGEAAVRKIPGALRLRLDQLRLRHDVDRLVTADSALALASALAGVSGRALTEALAGFSPLTSPKALSQHWANASSMLAALENDLVFGPFDMLEAQGAHAVGGAELLERVKAALEQDELNVKLAVTLHREAEEAQRLVVSAGRGGAIDVGVGVGVDRPAEAASAEITVATAALEAHGEAAHLVGTLEVRVQKSGR
jgi:hypothetical protein